MKFLYSLLAAMLFTGCASRRFQSESIDHSELGIPKVSKIDDVPFIKQKKNYCGPASLAMLLSHRNKSVKVEDLASQMYTPLKKGTFQTDMISATRRQGMMALPVTCFQNLVKEVAAGNPVLVFQNLGLKNNPRWHYAVLTGYDLIKKEFLLHSGAEKNLKTDMRLFEHSWSLGNFWALTILPPGQLSKTGAELDHMQAAVGLEQLEKFDEAEKAYLSILERWPFSLSALIGMGNIRFTQARFSEAVIFLKAASIKHPNSSTAWHNLALAQGAAKMLREASQSSRKAISLVDFQNEKSFRKSLKHYLK